MRASFVQQCIAVGEKHNCKLSESGLQCREAAYGPACVLQMSTDLGESSHPRPLSPNCSEGLQFGLIGKGP